MTKRGAGAETGKAVAAVRAERLGAALRANLKKRKELVRARQRSEEPNVPAPSTSKDSA